MSLGVVGTKAVALHRRIPGLRKLPWPAVAIILTLAAVNAITWAAVGIVLVRIDQF